MFLVTMVMFIVLALAQAFVPNVTWLVVIRFLLGIPLGSDISTGYTYIMESMAKGEREVMGNRWQFMFAVGEVLTIGVIVIFLLLVTGQTIIFLLRLVAADRRTRRRPMGSATKTVGELEDATAEGVEPSEADAASAPGATEAEPPES